MNEVFFNEYSKTIISPSQKSYLEELSTGDNYIDNYQILPEEYDIFSKLNHDLLLNKSSLQTEFLSRFLDEFKSSLLYLYSQYGIIKILPKMFLTTDDDQALILNWIDTNYRIFFNFENNVEDSYFGIAATDSESNFSSTSGKLNDNNYQAIIQKVIIYVCEK